MYYIAILTPDDGQITVSFPDLPGCLTCGDDLDDAMRMAADALSGHVETLRVSGNGVPAASDMASIEAGKGTLAAIPLIEDLGSKQPVNLSFDKGLVRAIDAAADKRGVTRSAFLATAARREIVGA